MRRLRIPKPYRPLAWFWAVVLGSSAIGAGVLQSMGPMVRVAKFAAVTVGPPKAIALAINAADPDLQVQDASLPGYTLPRIAPNGRRAETAYAAPADTTETRPRLALVVGGIGLAQGPSVAVLHDLPPAVTIAFSAYAPDSIAQPLAAQARAAGRECLLSVPLEPRDFPRDDAGPHTMLTASDPADRRKNLRWALSRRSGCMGATALSDGFSGAGYLQNGGLYGAMLQDIGAMGLAWFDPRPGAAVPAAAPPMVPASPTASRRLADVVIDAPDAQGDPPTEAAIDARLAALLDRARQTGHAIGVIGRPLPLVVDRTAAFAAALAAKGVALMPLSAMPKDPAKS